MIFELTEDRQDARNITVEAWLKGSITTRNFLMVLRGSLAISKSGSAKRITV